jgi:riboflavin transporter
MNSSSGSTLRRIIQITLLGTVGAVLMLLQIPFLGAPWLKLDISDVPVLIGGFALGPLNGIAILLIKNVLFALIRFNPIELIGLPMNFIATAIIVLLSAWYYQRNKTIGNAVIGLFLGIALSIIVMIPANYFVMPIFQRWLAPHMPVLSPRDLLALIIAFVLPFNAAKDIIM